MRAPVLSVLAATLAAIAGLALAAGEPPETTPPAPTPAKPSSEPKSEPAGAVQVPAGVEDQLKEIARRYTSWKRVSDQAWIAPTDCMARPPSGALLSDSGDDATHGKKLYYLYVKQQGPKFTYDYATSFEGEPPRQPVGQAIVKQSWEAVPVAVKDVPVTSDDHFARRHPENYLVLTDTIAYRTGAQRELFVMLKLDPATPNTDSGWVYATLEADGSKVIQAGAIASCMKCHEKAEYDRVFGQPRARRDRQAMKEREKKDAEAAKPAPESPDKPADGDKK